MKMLVRSLGLLSVGLLVAVVIYPTLHELGHALAAILVGARVKAWSVFPLSYVVCDFSGASPQAMAVVSLAGLLFPLLVSSVSCGGFWVWCAQLFLKCAALAALLLSGVTTLLLVNGNGVAQDDMAQLQQWQPYGIWVATIVIGAAAATAVFLLFRERPFARCAEFLTGDFRRTDTSVN